MRILFQQNRRAEAASGHERLDTPVPGGFHVYPEMAAAGLWTTASDLARWAIALSKSYRGEPGGVLSSSMAKQMVSKQMHQQPPYGNGYWGLGVAVAGDGDSLAFSHGGRDEGFVADMFMRPGTGRGLVIMMNGVAGGLMAEIERAFAEEYGFGGQPRTTRTAVPMSAAKLAEYSGRYVAVVNADTVRFDVSVAPDGKTLAVFNVAARRLSRSRRSAATTSSGSRVAERGTSSAAAARPDQCARSPRERGRIGASSPSSSMSQAFLRDDAEGEMPRRHYDLPDPGDPGFDLAAARALLEAARVNETQLAERATGLYWGEPRLRPHVEQILIEAQKANDERLEQVARRFLR